MDDRTLREELNELRRLVELERGDRHTADDDVRQSYRLDLDSLRREVRREFAGYVERQTGVLLDAVKTSRERVAPERGAGWRADWTSLIDSGVMSFRCTRPRPRSVLIDPPECDHVVHVQSGDSFLSLSNRLRGHVRKEHPSDPGRR